MGTISLSLTKQLYCTKSKSEKEKKTKTSLAYKLLQISALAGLYGFFAAYLFHSIEFIVEICSSTSLFDDDNFELFDFLVYNLLYTLAWSSFYTFMLIRIKYTFMNSIYALNNKLLYLHSVIAIFAPTLIIIGVFSNEAFIICSGTFVLLTAIGAAHLIYTFNHNLWLLLLLQNHSESSTHTSQMSKSNGHNKRDSKSGIMSENFNPTQRKLVLTVVKHTVLGCTMLISLGLCGIIVSFGSLIQSVEIKILLAHVNSILILSCGLALYCSFTPNKQLYLKLCGKCNDCTLKWYSNLADKRQEADEEEPNYVQEYVLYFFRCFSVCTDCNCFVCYVYIQSKSNRNPTTYSRNSKRKCYLYGLMWLIVLENDIEANPSN